MLSQDEQRIIQEELGHYEAPHAVIIDALKAIQRHRGWVSDEALLDLADYLGVSVHELDSIATFYNQIYRRPVGRHVIRICDSASCFVMGYEAIREKVSAELGVGFGETTADGRFTLLPNPCLGACDHAPVVLVDQDLHKDVRPDAIRTLLDEYQ
ncbi:MAG TPA: NADH-quinone oxidoreductase subunit NuoE [Gammaproteobacteria bacterium]|nr:NADH-quinone oxidoreductase subunit NuoE [Gammaproteobacteria bacterium]